MRKQRKGLSVYCLLGGGVGPYFVLCIVYCVLTGFVIISQRERERERERENCLLYLYYLLDIIWLFLTVPWFGL